MRRVHAVVSGRVQGVGFRWSTEAEARRLGLTGWVRNTYDGTVETEFEGTDEAVEAMVTWLRSGPRWSRVSGLTTREVVPKGGMGFAIRGDG